MGERRRRGAAVLAVGALLFGVAVPTATASSAGATLQVSTTTAAHGDVVTFEGTCPAHAVRAAVGIGSRPPQPPQPPDGASNRMSTGPPTFSTGVPVPIAADGSLAGSIVVAIDFEPDDRYRISLSCYDVHGDGDDAFDAVPFTIEASDPPVAPNEVTLPSGSLRPGDTMRVDGTALLAPGRPADSGHATLFRLGTNGESIVRQWSFPVDDDASFVAHLPLSRDLRPGEHWLQLWYRAGDQSFGGDQYAFLDVRGPRFDDVAGGPHARAIAALSDHGVTLGCGGGRFCPDAPIRRDQFASLLHRATERFPSGDPRRFRDVPPDSPHAVAISTLADRGAIRGCATDRFCPSDTLRRDQTVSLLVRDRYDWVEARGRQFLDVPADSPHADEILRARSIDLALGCAPDRFCPRRPVTRAQAASFVARAFGWGR